MDKVRFLHIPKTAGSSFDEGIFLMYMKAYIYGRRFTFSGNTDRDIYRYNQIPKSRRESIVIYTGHAPRTTGIAEIDRLPTVTLLRNPIERVKSFCQHVSEGKSANLNDNFDYRNMDLDAFLDSGRTQLSNLQSKYLLGEGRYALPEGDTESIVDLAVNVLDRELICFGITEEFDKSLLLLKHVLGWPKLPIYRRRNSRNEKVLLEFEEHHIKKIEELNQVDIRVYDHACALFKKRIDARSVLVMDELPLFQEKVDSGHIVFPAIDAVRWLKRMATQSPGSS